MNDIIIKNVTIINEENIFNADVRIKDGVIHKVGPSIQVKSKVKEIDGEGLHLIPGVIDTHVHFREPGLTHKGDIQSESMAAVAGGVTSYMEMPNTIPPAISQDQYDYKYKLALGRSYANYSFYFGASENNFTEIMKCNPKRVCGVKIFMSDSTGNLRLNNPVILEKIFRNSPILIALHSEDQETINSNLNHYIALCRGKIPAFAHPQVRPREACIKATRFATELAKKYKSRLHVLHLSTKDEISFFESGPVKEKLITCETCTPYLLYDEDDYYIYENLIKVNPSIKSKDDKDALLEAIKQDKIDVISTDHAPHLYKEKKEAYLKAPAGIPFVQHSLSTMLTFYFQGKLSLESIVRKMCHAPADCFRLEKRGYVREGYWADLALLNLKQRGKVDKSNIHYKCRWSPLEGRVLKGNIEYTFVNGKIVYSTGNFHKAEGMPLEFKT